MVIIFPPMKHVFILLTALLRCLITARLALRSLVASGLLYFLTAHLSCLAESVGKIEVVGPDTVDFGKYPAREKKIAVYKIRNTGNGVLKILNLHKNCACATAKSNKMELQPKEEAEIEVVILPNSIFNLYSKNVFVENSDQSNRLLKLTMAGNAISLITIKPNDFLNAGYIPLKQPWFQSFDLKASEPGVMLGDVKVESNYPVETGLEKILENEIANYKLNTKLLPASSHGDLSCSMAIPVIQPTNHPPIRIIITGKIGALLHAVPGIAYLPLSNTPITRQFLIRMLGQGTQTLNPESLKLPEHKGVSFDVKLEPDGRVLQVKATFSPEFTKELSSRQKISLPFSIPDASPAEIVCKFSK